MFMLGVCMCVCVCEFPSFLTVFCLLSFSRVTPEKTKFPMLTTQESVESESRKKMWNYPLNVLIDSFRNRV